MKLTLSIIKADIGSIGGHLAPSRRLLEYTGIVEKLKALDARFVVRGETVETAFRRAASR